MSKTKKYLEYIDALGDTHVVGNVADIPKRFRKKAKSIEFLDVGGTSANPEGIDLVASESIDAPVAGQLTVADPPRPVIRKSYAHTGYVAYGVFSLLALIFLIFRRPSWVAVLFIGATLGFFAGQNLSGAGGFLPSTVPPEWKRAPAALSNTEVLNNTENPAQFDKLLPLQEAAKAVQRLKEAAQQRQKLIEELEN